MKIVGSYIGAHDVGFSLIENNQILACYTEERFSRIKSAYASGAFPSHSFEAIQKDFDFDIKDPNVKFAVAKPFIHHKHHDIINVLKNKSKLKFCVLFFFQLNHLFLFLIFPLIYHSIDVLHLKYHF